MVTKVKGFNGDKIRGGGFVIVWNFGGPGCVRSHGSTGVGGEAQSSPSPHPDPIRAHPSPHPAHSQSSEPSQTPIQPPSSGRDPATTTHAEQNRSWYNSRLITRRKYWWNNIVLGANFGQGKKLNPLETSFAHFSPNIIIVKMNTLLLNQPDSTECDNNFFKLAHI